MRVDGWAVRHEQNYKLIFIAMECGTKIGQSDRRPINADKSAQTEEAKKVVGILTSIFDVISGVSVRVQCPRISFAPCRKMKKRHVTHFRPDVYRQRGHRCRAHSFASKAHNSFAPHHFAFSRCKGAICRENSSQKIRKLKNDISKRRQQ